MTIFITVAGTFLGLLIMSMFAYSISRKDFKLSKFLSIYLLIPMLFNGGQLAGYIIFTSYYGLKDSLWLLILPLCVSTMNVIILRTYIANSIPAELMEAAKIDGAGEYRTFFQITLPLLKPSLAAVGFMMATAYWNDWQNALLYIASDSKKPLQLLLVNIQKSIEFLLNNSNVPASVRAAMGAGLPERFFSAASDTKIELRESLFYCVNLLFLLNQNGDRACCYRTDYGCVSVFPEIFCKGLDSRICQRLINLIFRMYHIDTSLEYN